jgi:hypothetical protein
VSETCETCKFFKDTGRRGYCYRYPPLVYVEKYWEGGAQYEQPATAWPQVGLIDWCGEYSALQNQDDHG